MTSIPKIVHQIWIGPNKRPDCWMNSVRDFCKEYNYKYKLWDDEAVSTLDMINRSFYESQNTYYGKSDILRYEILYQFGGAYIDADSYILKADKFNNILEEFTEDVGFGYETDGALICQGVSISQQHSKFINECIKAIPTRNLNQAAWLSVGPMMITDLYKIFHKTITIKLYPSKVFYPVSWHGITSIDAHKNIDIPEESVMFQYGYSTNNLQDKINENG